MIITFEGPMGSGMSMFSTYMAYMLRNKYGYPVKFNYAYKEMSIPELEKRLNNIYGKDSNVKILRMDNFDEKI